MSPTGKLRIARAAWIASVMMAAGSGSAIYTMAQSNPVGIVILDQLGPGYRAYWVLGISLLLSFAISIFLRHRILIARQHRNELTAELLLENLREDKPVACKEFFVYLRSFETTGHLKPPFFFTMAVLGRLHTNELESFLALSLEKKGPLVALGLPGESVGAARIHVDDTTWKDDIQRLLTHASGLLVVPSAHEGTKWEIELLQKDDLLKKAVFIMPPKTRQFDWRVRWEQASQSLREFSITLPEYNERGLLFRLDEQGQVADARMFSLMFRRSIRKSIEALLKGARENRSGSDAIRKANRRARMVWFYGTWVSSFGSLIATPIMLWFAIHAFLSGRVPRAVDTSPPWSTFTDRYDSAEEVNSAQGLLGKEIFFRSHRWLSESEIDQLAKQGLLRVDEMDRELYQFGFGEMLSLAPNEHVCAALAEGRASELDRIRTLVTMPSHDVNLWMSAREKAARAAARDLPLVAGIGEPGADLKEAISAVLGRQGGIDLEDLLTAGRKLTEEETCRLGIAGATAVYRLREPYRAQLSTVLASR